MRTSLRVAGIFLAMSLAVMAATLVSVPLFTDAKPWAWAEARPQLGNGWLAFEFAYSVPIALAAGFLVARWGREAPWRHVVALAVVVLGMGVASVGFSAGQKPVLHDVAMTLAGSLAVLAGGGLHLRGHPSTRAGA